MSSSAPQIFFTVRDQVFRITVSSLKPSTVHYFYVERVKVSASKIKPVGGSLGDSIVTDSDGKVTFDYYFDSGISTNATEVDQAQKIANTIAGKKEIVVTDSNVASLVDNFEKTTQSYFISAINVSVYVVPENEYIKNIVKVPAAVRITPAPIASVVDYSGVSIGDGGGDAGGGGDGGGGGGDGGGDGGG